MCVLSCISGFGEDPNCQLTLKGVVLDDTTRLPVEDVGVGIVQSQAGIVTDSTGKFIFTGLCKKPVTIALSHLGSKTLEVNINLKNDTTLVLLLNALVLI